jgi:hypothetical protein
MTELLEALELWVQARQNAPGLGEELSGSPFL